ncbi:hypothetical protein SYNPS1DRAFT_25800 [Syncephalis pseudoplumigaleata]|uniref:Uncharacterized protein n=1 Tax=Syncephalis pseudoplumigaleata TaxID=1712513 RepID=A0A4P9YRT3_9FUNG|nr:hypothetical protein SYNPS1DRAFT_25800 [Syncephalis pseudoplumigaleata]|eukprot:RKP22454.1 hypothetical protein SYNPS1DRAFT_25800 [Syncephalis pseudoplumigaleata]
MKFGKPNDKYVNAVTGKKLSRRCVMAIRRHAGLPRSNAIYSAAIPADLLPLVRPDPFEEVMATPAMCRVVMAEAATAGTGFLINTGMNTWALEWCPCHTTASWQYLAVAGLPVTDTASRPIGQAESAPSGGGQLQFWRVPVDDAAVDAGKAAPMLDAVMLHQWGTIWDMTWCPASGAVEAAASR